MKRHAVKVCTVMAAVLFLSVTVLQLNADARGGGGRSFGSRGSRSFSRPATPTYKPAPSAPVSGGLQQSSGGGFMRGMAGGMMGGMLGSMLFSGAAGAGDGTGAASGGGIGMFEIILLAGGGYLVYRYIRKRRMESTNSSFNR